MAQDPTYWDGIYSSKEEAELSWTRDDQGKSLELLQRYASPPASVIDVGAGRSDLAAVLLDQGWADLCVLDVSAEGLERARASRGPLVMSVVADETEWKPERTFDAWHDRAVLHFLTKDHERAAYAATAASAIRPGGVAVIGCFAPDGPETCSGLPVRRSSAEDLARDLGDSFELIDSTTEVHTTPWGAVQRFTWVVLRRR